MSSFPDYYALLKVSNDATSDEIRQAYKKESLRTHPDRLTKATPEEKTRATERFQAVADAYYVLSDPQRRREYDSLYSTRSRSQRYGPEDAEAANASSSNFFNAFASMFAGATAGGAPKPEAAAGAQRPDADGVFTDVFEDLLRPEVERHASWWSYLGAASGAGIGFIIGNLPGLMLGAYGGKRLGAIRDAKGKAVGAVFMELGNDQKAEILRALAMKVLGSATS